MDPMYLTQLALARSRADAESLRSGDRRRRHSLTDRPVPAARTRRRRG
jgi:hypothetical protein